MLHSGLLLGVRNATLGRNTLVESVFPKASELSFSLWSWSQHWVREYVIITRAVETGSWLPLLGMLNTNGRVRLCFPKPRHERVSHNIASNTLHHWQ